MPDWRGKAAERIAAAIALFAGGAHGSAAGTGRMRRQLSGRRPDARAQALRIAAQFVD